MKRMIFVVLVVLAFAVSATAQSSTQAKETPGSASAAAGGPSAKPKRQIFRATKEQIKQAQTMLKTSNLYSGEPSGSLDETTRASIRGYQKMHNLRVTGTLNRATLEKMGIELTESQKAIPVSESAAASGSGAAADDSGKPKRTIFRATKEQIADAQQILKSGNMYSGEATGKLDEDTRAALKKYQEANGLKVTGTLNQATLEKMGIALTDKQKEASTAAKK